MWADSKRRYRRYALGLDRLESCKGLKQYLNRCEQSNRKQLTDNKENAPARMWARALFLLQLAVCEAPSIASANKCNCITD